MDYPISITQGKKSKKWRTARPSNNLYSHQLNIIWSIWKKKAAIGMKRNFFVSFFPDISNYNNNNQNVTQKDFLHKAFLNKRYLHERTLSWEEDAEVRSYLYIDQGGSPGSVSYFLPSPKIRGTHNRPNSHWIAPFRLCSSNRMDLTSPMSWRIYFSSSSSSSCCCCYTSTATTFTGERSVLCTYTVRCDLMQLSAAWARRSVRPGRTQQSFPETFLPLALFSVLCVCVCFMC